jgi:hypothetical protein
VDPRRITANALGLLLIGGLGSCGYGGTDIGGSSLPPPPGSAGYYAGELVSPVTGTGDEVVALVDDDGNARIIDALSGTQYLVTLPADGGDLNARVTGYAGPMVRFPDKSHICHGSLDGTLYAATELFGNYSCGGDQGTLDLVYDDDVSFNPPDPTLLTGALQTFITPVTILALIVAPDGSYTGTDTAGCSYSGSFAPADAIIDIYAMNLTQICPSTTLTLTGLATPVTDPKSGLQSLYYGVSDGSHSLAGRMDFQ